MIGKYDCVEVGDMFLNNHTDAKWEVLKIYAEKALIFNILTEATKVAPLILLREHYKWIPHEGYLAKDVLQIEVGDVFRQNGISCEVMKIHKETAAVFSIVDGKMHCDTVKLSDLISYYHFVRSK
jgi:hypothetical protein